MRSPTTTTRRLENASTSASSRSLRSASPGRGCTLRAINMRQYPARRGRKIIDDGDRFQAGRRRVRRVALPQQNRASAGRATGADVEPRVAHDERPRGIEAEIGGSPVNHAAARLPAIAFARVRLDLSVRMMRTIVIAV